MRKMYIPDFAFKDIRNKPKVLELAKGLPPSDFRTKEEDEAARKIFDAIEAMGEEDALSFLIQ